MFSWLCRPRMSRPRSQPWRGNRVIPRLEALEDRYCPSALAITSFNNMIEQGKTVMLSGTVTDANPASVQITFSGVASGTTMANSSGNFSLQVQASQLGTIYAQGVDGAGLSSNQAQTTLVDNYNWSISGLTVQQEGGHNVMVTGTLNGNNTSSVTVTLSGVVSGSATTTTTGSFSFSGTASALGQITASVTDVWGVSSSAAANLTDPTPQITNFTVINDGMGYYSFSGQVVAAYAPGMTVNLSGLSSGQVIVGNDDYFNYMVYLGNNHIGDEYAVTTDWWGAVSNRDVVYVT